jgi:hypothetical protein
VKRWPLFFIALPAAVAVWSGWVGLGQLCGFGIVHPLPGIVDRFQINSAITLPVGVEAYGAYALGAWLTPGTPDRARTFARRSAIGALVLGMLGQVVYHLLAATHATRAPWPVVVLVACLPVVTLGFGAGLAHLLRDDAAGTRPAESEITRPDYPPEPREPLADSPSEISPPEADSAPAPAPALVPVPATATEAAAASLRATIAAGNPLSGRQLEARFGLTRSEAAKVRQLVLAGANGHAAEDGNDNADQ